jgi:UDP-N-acetylmuramate--alanine ligase
VKVLKKRDLPLPANATIHLVGIGGAGMSSLATLLWDAGYAVSGSDLNLTPTIESLRAAGIPIAIGHDASNVQGCSIVVRSSAVPETNPEIQHARQLGLQVVKHAEFVGLLSQSLRTLAVSGTSGKTTTTAMLATIGIESGLDPIILVGGILPRLGSGAHLGASQFLIVEADEFDRRFLHLRPEVAVVTNVEADHLDYYSGLPEIVEAFETFIDLVPEDGWIVACADNPISAQLAARHPERSITYGLSPTADWRAVGISKNDVGGNDFYVMAHDTLVGHFRLRVPGLHNVCDALAATVAAGRIGVDFTSAASALEGFVSVHRRLERKGEAKGVVVYDDYSHHPSKIRAGLAALREVHDGRIVCLFQPHTYHRLASLFDDFSHAFSDADLVVVTDVYEPAGRGPGVGQRTSPDLARSIVGTAVRYGGDLRSAVEMIAQVVRPGDLVVTMGAGDVTTAGPRLIEMLSRDEVET